MSNQRKNPIDGEIKKARTSTSTSTKAPPEGVPMCEEVGESAKPIQWVSTDNQVFMPRAKTIITKALPPGVYDTHQWETGTVFLSVPVKTEGLLRFPDSTSNIILTEIQKFWDSESKFNKYELPFKRGMLLWGPPGSGKSCTIALAMEDVIQRGGIVIRFMNPNTFIHGYRDFREVQPNTPVVVTMEDLDSILDTHCESAVLNILDGIESVSNTVFLATTNYPERLGARIVNRPSRFDKRFRIGMPGPESRRMYLRNLFKDEVDSINMDQWVKDTNGFSLAHLKELFVSVHIIENEYAEAIETLSCMREEIKEELEFLPKGGSIGFGSKVQEIGDSYA